MAGCVIPRTPIAVDCWKRRSNPQAKLFFLSHMHSDHTVGLNSSWNQTIYCSEITKALAIEKFDIAPSLMVAIPIGQSTILDLDEIGVEKLTVTLIDANHCPGAVMFLFQGYFGQILCTGDFRYVDGMLDVAPLKTNPTINTLYLDNTYCKLDCEFPSRSDAILMILNILQEHLNRDIVFGLDTLGKEELLFKIAMVLEVPIVVDEYRLKTTKLLGYNVGFTTDPNASHIRVVPRNQVNRYTVSLWNKEHPTIAILPTCRFVGSSGTYAIGENILVVPYSDHSSFSELKQFVAALKPQQIIPIVKTNRDPESGSRADMSVFNAEKSPDATPHMFDVPASVLIFMSGGWNVDMRSSHHGKKRKPLSFFKSRSKKPCGVVFPSHKNRPITTAGGSRKESESAPVFVTKFNEAENSAGSARKPAFDEGVGTVEGGECEAMSTHRVQTDNPSGPVKKVQEHCHVVESYEILNVAKTTSFVEQGYCECEDTVAKNLEEVHIPKVKIKMEPEEDCIAEKNWAQREHRVAEEAVAASLCHHEKACLYEEKYTCAFENDRDQELNVRSEGNSTKTQFGLAEEAVNTSFCYPENVFLYEGKQESAFEDDKGQEMSEKGDGHDEAGNNGYVVETDNVENEVGGVAAAKPGPVKLCAMETNGVCERRKDRELSKKCEGDSTESQYSIAEVAANQCNSENMFHHLEKYMDVLENDGKEMQDDLAEKLSEQPKAMLSAETNEICDITPPEERNNLRMALEEDYSPVQYCFGQLKRRHSNIYGGSCTLAWDVVQKLKAKRHSE